MKNDFEINTEIISRVESLVTWYRKAQANPYSMVLPHPKKNRWKEWDDNRIWCSMFFSIGVPGSSRQARNYLEPVEDGLLEFELRPDILIPLNKKERLKSIWKFGRGGNRLGKALGRFFSKPQNLGRINSCEQKLTEIFEILHQKKFKDWFIELEEIQEDREKANALEILPGVGQKISRDFLNDIGLTESVIPIDIHILSEMRELWNWNVPKNTPSNRVLYEELEDKVREISKKINCTVVEIDKSIYFSRMSKEF